MSSRPHVANGQPDQTIRRTGFRPGRWAYWTAVMAFALSLSPSAPADEAPPQDWFHVIALDRVTYAISEPKYWQANVSYLLLGSRSALLFDTGPGVYSIRPVVKSLTKLPITVVPSHLHFDHIGRIQEFSHIALLGNEALRREMHGDMLTLTTAQCLLRVPCSFRVAQWLTDGESIDLGNRHVSILGTPGHTPDSVTLVDSKRHWLFTGDLLNRGGSLYDVPGSDLTAVASSLHRLQAFARRGYTAYEAHSERPIPSGEFLKTSQGVLDAIGSFAHGKPVCLDGVPARQLDVNGFVVVLPSDADERLRPLASSTVEIDWRDKPCSST
jgi:glyoxylase-like metal-dependent hydrolase (beta-lactamase superfamily II)